MVSERNAAGRMCLLDMHAHLSCFMDKSEPGADVEERHALAIRELEQRHSDNISTFFSSGTLDEWKFMQRYRDREEVFLSFGIHPWYADSCSAMWPDVAEVLRGVKALPGMEGLQGAKALPGTEASHREHSVQEALAEAFKTCDAIGEIGMDSVWCEVPMDIQRRSFERQLQIAADLKKPVILHTKGMEREIAAMVRDFPEPVCVHWYSGGIESFEAFLEMGCYFTLGPDFAEVCVGRSGVKGGKEISDALQERKSGMAEPEIGMMPEKSREPEISREPEGNAETEAKEALYRIMLREIPAERLFVETDGVSSIAWARGTEMAEVSEIPGVLSRNMDLIAETKNIQRDELYERMWKNLGEFFRKTGRSQYS